MSKCPAIDDVKLTSENKTATSCWASCSSTVLTGTMAETYLEYSKMRILSCITILDDQLLMWSVEGAISYIELIFSQCSSYFSITRWREISNLEFKPTTFLSTTWISSRLPFLPKNILVIYKCSLTIDHKSEDIILFCSTVRLCLESFLQNQSWITYNLILTWFFSFFFVFLASDGNVIYLNSNSEKRWSNLRRLSLMWSV